MTQSSNGSKNGSREEKASRLKEERLLLITGVGAETMENIISLVQPGSNGSRSLESSSKKVAKEFLRLDSKSLDDERCTIIESLFTIAEVWEARSTCLRGHAGAVIATPNGGVLSQGYNGAPRGVQHCTEGGCIIDQDHCVRSIHAEMNAIIWAAYRGIGLGGEGNILVSTVRPCIRCTMAAINAGITQIYYDRPYSSDDEEEVFRIAEEAGMTIFQRGEL